MLRGLRWSRVDVASLDSTDVAVRFSAGPRLVLDAVVATGGTVRFAAGGKRLRYAYGSAIANNPRVLALLCVVFVLMTAVWPVWRLRNLDVAVALSTVCAIILLNASMFGRMVVVSYPALFYFVARCGWYALGSTRGSRASVPLFDLMTGGWSEARRKRLLGLTAGAFVLITAMVAFSSTDVVDVGYASMEGATKLLGGVLPYGHISDVFHGDTYPIGSYLFYVPFAWLSPVQNQWDSADLTLLVALAAALGVGGMLLRTAPRPDRSAGLRAAIAWLAFPPVLVTVSTGTTDVLLAFLLLGAVLLWRRPTICCTLLAAGAWFKLSPLALLPLALARLRGQRLVRALAGVVAISTAALAALIALGGPGAIGEMARALGYQTSRNDPRSLWAVLGSVPWQQLAQAGTLALIAGGAVRLARDPILAGDRVRVAGLCCAILLGLQISAGYWTYMYLVWVFPFLALSVLQPAERLSASHVRARS
jgi:hypothetical protein